MRWIIPSDSVSHKLILNLSVCICESIPLTPLPSELAPSILHETSHFAFESLDPEITSFLIQSFVFGLNQFNCKFEHKLHYLDLEPFFPNPRISREKRKVLDLQVTSQCRWVYWHPSEKLLLCSRRFSSVNKAAGFAKQHPSSQDCNKYLSILPNFTVNNKVFSIIRAWKALLTSVTCPLTLIQGTPQNHYSLEGRAHLSRQQPSLAGESRRPDINKVLYAWKTIKGKP